MYLQNIVGLYQTSEKPLKRIRQLQPARVNTSNLFLHVVIQLLDSVKAGLEPPVLFAPLSKEVLQLTDLLLVFLVTHIDTP